MLFELVNENGGEILKKVKGCEMFHLKRVMFILGGKLAEKLPEKLPKKADDPEVSNTVYN